jgi:hypothetical protein
MRKLCSPINIPPKVEAERSTSSAEMKMLLWSNENRKPLVTREIC